jgi:hypothetical protein
MTEGTKRSGPGEAVSWRWSAALALGLFLTDLLLAPHVVADGDAAELTLVLVSQGVAHPTGYPLFTLFGHLFVSLLRLAGAGYAFAANAWSAAGGAAAAFFLHRLSLRLMPPSSAPDRLRRFCFAAVPVLLLGFQPQWLEACTLVEVYSWHVAWVCGAALFLVFLLQELKDPEHPFPMAARMLAWGAVCGAGCAHHSTSVFYAAAYSLGLAWVLFRAGRLSVRVVLLWIGGALVPLSSYAYLVLRAAHPGTASVWPALEPSLRGLAGHVSGEVYRGFLGRWNPDPDQAAELAHGVYPLLWPAVLLMAFWLVAARSVTDRTARGTLLGAGLLQLAFVYRYGVPDPAGYFLAPLATFLPVTAGLGLAAVSRGRTAWRRNLLAAVLGVLLVAPLAALGVGSFLERRREVVHYDEVIRSMWSAVADEPSIFLWASDSYYKIKLYQRLEGEKPQIDVQDTAMLCKPYPEELFRRRYGFDPLANNGPEHARDSIDPKYFSEEHRILGDRFLARVNQTIADSAALPVLLFNGHEMTLRRLSRGRPSPGQAPGGAR